MIHTPKIYPREQHNISRADIDPDALKLMYRLIHAGFKGYMVGGGVRDLLLGKNPKDFDISTDATPSQVKRLFRNCRIIGRRFKLCHIYFHGGKIIELSTFRDLHAPADTEQAKLLESGQILRDNRYGTEETDAFRRDITINALFYDLSTFSVIDYVGGMEDLRARLIRIIGDPDLRFAEDPVRLIRVIRHAARANFEIDEDCWRALVKGKDLILQTVPVRVFEEVKKDLLCGRFLTILRLFAESGLLEHLLPELTINDCAPLYANHPFAKALSYIDSQVLTGRMFSPTTVFSIMALYSGGENDDLPILRFKNKDEVSQFLRKCFGNLQFPKKERERVQFLLNALFDLSQSNVTAKRIGTFRSKPFIEDLVDLLSALNFTKRFDDLIEQLEYRSQQAGKIQGPRASSPSVATASLIKRAGSPRSQ